MTVQAAYLVQTEDVQRVRDGFDWSPNSRAALAAFRSTLRCAVWGGRESLRWWSGAARWPGSQRNRLSAIPGIEVMNEVVLNQVLFRLSDDSLTDAALAEAQLAGDVWLSGTKIDGRSAIRLSVSNWQTDEKDIERVIRSFSGGLRQRLDSVAEPDLAGVGPDAGSRIRRARQ